MILTQIPSLLAVKFQIPLALGKNPQKIVQKINIDIKIEPLGEKLPVW